jgi:hypothetical protein
MDNAEFLKKLKKASDLQATRMSEKQTEVNSVLDRFRTKIAAVKAAAKKEENVE